MKTCDILNLVDVGLPMMENDGCAIVMYVHCHSNRRGQEMVREQVTKPDKAEVCTGSR